MTDKPWTGLRLVRLVISAGLLLSAHVGCSNVLRSGLMNSNSILLPPSAERSVYVQTRNTSENQNVGLTSLSSRLSGKGYQIVKDPAQAGYWLQTQKVYCHKTAAGLSAEAIAKSGFGTGLGSGGASLAGAVGGGGGDPTQIVRNMMSGAMGGRMVGMGGGGMPDMNAMMTAAMRSGGYPGMAPPPEEEGVTYVCIADIRITERNGAGGGPKVYEMRSVGHVLQKKLDIEEATPIVRDKLSTAIAGVF
jgi:TraT complement resistance protein